MVTQPRLYFGDSSCTGFLHNVKACMQFTWMIRNSWLWTSHSTFCFMVSPFSPQPHKHSKCKPLYRNNYCTNMDNLERKCRGRRPWCYTMDPKKRWEYCAIPKCKGALTIKALHHVDQYVFTHWVDASYRREYEKWSGVILLYKRNPSLFSLLPYGDYPFYLCCLFVFLLPLMLSMLC